MDHLRGDCQIDENNNNSNNNKKKSKIDFRPNSRQERMNETCMQEEKRKYEKITLCIVRVFFVFCFIVRFTGLLLKFLHFFRQ